MIERTGLPIDRSELTEPKYDYEQTSISFTTLAEIANQPMVVQQTLFIRGTILFQFTGAYAPDQKEILLPSYQKIVNTFELE